MARGLTWLRWSEVIKNWYAMDQLAIVVFDESYLKSIVAGSNLVGILHDKYFDVKQLA
jgi:hypothetical protein